MNQTSVDSLLKKLEDYVKKHLDHYNDILCVLTGDEDPVDKLDKVKDTLVSDEQKEKIKNGGVFEGALMKDEITRFGHHKTALHKNIGKIFELIWGQCSTSIETLIKGDDKFKKNKEDNNAKWLITELRQLTSGVDSQANAADVYFQSLWEWTHLRQGENESNDSFQKRADTASQNLILAEGEDVLYP